MSMPLNADALALEHVAVPLETLLANFKDIKKGRSSLSFEQIRQGLVETSRGLEHAFPEQAQDKPGRVAQDICERVLEVLDSLDGASKDDVLSDAIRTTAQRIDKDAAGVLPKYHGAPHYFDTALSTFVLALTDYATNPQTVMTPLGIKTLFLAGLGHDLGHPGTNNGKDANQVPNFFKFEDQSHQIMADELHGYGFGQELEILKYLYRATDPDGGTKLVDEALAYHQAGRDPALRKASEERIAPLGNAALADLQKHLFDNEKLTIYADLLTKGDIAASIIEPDLAAHKSALFHAEFAEAVQKGQIAPQAQLRFIDEETHKVLPGGYKYFVDNIVGELKTPTVAKLLGPALQHTKAVLLDGKPAYPNPAIPGLSPAVAPLPRVYPGYFNKGFGAPHVNAL